MTVKIPMALTREHLRTMDTALLHYGRGAPGTARSSQELLAVGECRDFLALLNGALSMERGQGFARIRLQEDWPDAP